MRNLCLAAFLVLLAGCGAEQKANEARLAALEEQVKKIDELQVTIARRTGLGALVRPAAVPFDDGHVIGNPDAPIVIMEFTDLQCPFCAKFHQDTFPELKAQFIDTGKVVFVGRDFPLINTHKQAGYAAVALRCGRAQVDYTEFKQYLFDNMGKLVPEDVTAKVVELGGQAEAHDACMQNRDLHAAVQQSFQFAMELGLPSTPSFLVGVNDKQKVKDFQVVSGAGTVEQFAEIINKLAQ